METVNQKGRFVSVFKAVVLCLCAPMAMSAQGIGDWQWFGSLQTMFFYQRSEGENTVRTQPCDPCKVEFSVDRNTFALQQMDFFISKPIDDNFDVFIDLEFKMNYNSEHNWGALSVQEAWMNYTYSNKLNLKAGLLYPEFNQLNTVKNRLALLPYVFRPIVYERLLSERFFIEDFVPEFAFIQLHGSFPMMNRHYLDYAIYMGNSESSYNSSRSGDMIESWMEPNFEFLSGADPNGFSKKLYGARVGLRSMNENVKVGVSATHDYNNLRDTIKLREYFITVQHLDSLRGDAPRIRLGADFSVKYGNFTLESEFIKVLYDYDLANDLDLTMEQDYLNVFLGYNILSDLMAYSMVCWSKYQIGDTHRFGLYSGGVSYFVNNNISLKAQYIRYFEKVTPWYIEAKSELDFVFLGCSILL